jgi:DNA-binding MarR family transcriptional regulator
MAEDFVRSLGLPFLAHRLRRASELILEGSAEALRGFGSAAPTRAGSTLLLLRAHGPMGITEIAFRLRLSHPLISRLTDALAGEGLVSAETDPKDQRRRLIALTPKGEAEASRLEAFSQALARAFEAMFAESGVNLFAAIERFEAVAEARPVADRLAAELARVPAAS